VTDNKVFMEVMFSLAQAAVAFVEAQSPLASGDLAAPQFDALERQVMTLKAIWQADTRGMKGDA